ncbi:hypothetical protein HELRODRAFT_178840 [Helobdella robusta]|uniref:Uncharacterized protein n=1 Tax=Helobdella robusta TaxID=6412 RepID=T1FDT5_HELRO|nr:hypothetical protein HELRODRAFT_178840 [Helobdella robusta]ESN95923.1 hypothetical protein HELRODRAFT_178840 [Helobdella robusta]
MLSDLTSEWNKFGRLSFQGDNGETLLHIAACNGYGSVSNFLLDTAGQSATTADKDGWQPLHCAAYWQHLKVIESLMNHGANVYDKTLDGETVLDLCKDANICDWMIQRSADNRHNNFNQSSSSLRKSQMRRSSSSAKRLNAEKKEKRRKKDVQNEFERLMSSQNDLDDNDGNNKNNNNRHGEVNSNRHNSYPKLLNNNNNSNNNIKNVPDDESCASRQGNRGSILGSNVLNFYNNHSNIDYCESPRLLSLQSTNNYFGYNNTSLDANYLKSDSPSSRSRANSKNSNISVESEKKLSSLPEFGESNGKVSLSRERSQSCKDETVASSAQSSRKESKKKFSSVADKLSKSKKASKNYYENMPTRARSLKNESNKFSSFENEFSNDGTDRKRSESTKRHNSSSRNNLTEAGLNPERKSLSLNQLIHDQYVGELYGKKKLTKSKFSSNNKCLIS